MASNIAVVLVTRNIAEPEVLVCRAPNHKAVSGNWDLPKGHVEEGEPVILGAVRELYEETGIECNPEDLDFIAIVEGVGGNILHIHEFDGEFLPEDFKFSCHSTFEWYGKQLPEMVEWRWVPLSIATMYLYKNLQRVIEKYYEMKGE